MASFNKKKVKLGCILHLDVKLHACVRSMEATQILLLPSLDEVQQWHFKDLMLGSQSCQRAMCFVLAKVNVTNP